MTLSACPNREAEDDRDEGPMGQPRHDLHRCLSNISPSLPVKRRDLIHAARFIFLNPRCRAASKGEPARLRPVDHAIATFPTATCRGGFEEPTLSMSTAYRSDFTITEAAKAIRPPEAGRADPKASLPEPRAATMRSARSVDAQAPQQN